MKASQLAGLLLWRAGLLIVTIGGFYYGAWQFVQQLDLPLTLEVALALICAGIGLVMVSMIVERVNDAKREGDLT